MRIDFSRLEKNQIQPSITNAILSSSLSNLWKQAQSKTHENDIAKHQQQPSQNLSFAVNYPFEINRSLSPSSLRRCFDYLEAKKQLPSSTIKFIKTNLHSEIEKHANAKQTPKNNTLDLRNLAAKESLDLDPFRKKKSQNVNCLLNKINNNKKEEGKEVNSLNFKKKYYDVKPRVYEIKSNPLREQKYRKQQNLEGVTLKPMLNYTMNSKLAKRVDQKRNKHFKTCQINVFQSLYHDASLYATKRQMQKAIMEEQSKESRCIARKESRIKVYSTFQQRLQSSIEKVAQRNKKAQNKLDFDPATGRKCFIPDTTPSKKTLNTHFRSQKISILPPQESFFPARGIDYSKSSQKMNRSQEMTTTLNNSYEKDLNKSLDGKYKILRKPIQKENKLAQIYADILWSEQNLKQQSLNKLQRKVLYNFIKDIQGYLLEHKYSKNINRQVFIAIFKDFYSGLNLFDRAILDGRYKKYKKAQKQFNFNKNLNSNMRKQTQSLTSGRKKSMTNTDHYHKHRQYFI